MRRAWMAMVVVGVGLTMACGEAPEEEAHGHDHDHGEHDHGEHDGNHGAGEGREDDVALMAVCEIMTEAAATAMVASTQDEAADHVIMPAQQVYEVALPADEQAFLTVHIPNDHTDATFYVAPGSGLVALHQGGAVVHALEDGTQSEQCVGQFDQYFPLHIHMGGMYVLEFEAGEARTARFVLEAAGSDHGGDHGDHGGDHGG